MSPCARVLSCLAVLFVAACTLPIPSRGADIRLEWTEPSPAARQAIGARIYEQTGAGWTLVGTLPRSVDANVALAGFQQAFTVSRGPGTYTFRVTSYNANGETTPSNNVSPEIGDIPLPPIGLTFTIVVS